MKKIVLPKLALICCATLVALASCATLQKLIQSPKLAYQSTDLIDPGLDGITLGLNFNIDNPNPIGARLDQFNYKLTVNDKQALAGDFKQGVSVPASGRGSFQVPVRLLYRDTFASLEQLVSQKSLRYRVEGQAKIGPFSIPYAHEGEFSPPKLPTLKLTQLQVQELGISGASLAMHLKVKNPNGFTIPFDKLRYGLKLGSAQLLEGDAGSLAVAPNGESDLTLPLKVSGVAVAQSILSALQGKQANYSLSLSTEVKGQNLNLGSAGVTPVTK